MTNIEEIKIKLDKVEKEHPEVKFFFGIIDQDNSITWGIDNSTCFICLLEALIAISIERNIQHLGTERNDIVYH